MFSLFVPLVLIESDQRRLDGPAGGPEDGGGNGPAATAPPPTLAPRGLAPKLPLTRCIGCCGSVCTVRLLNPVVGCEYPGGP